MNPFDKISPTERRTSPFTGNDKNGELRSVVLRSDTMSLHKELMASMLAEGTEILSPSKLISLVAVIWFGLEERFA